MTNATYKILFSVCIQLLLLFCLTSPVSYYLLTLQNVSIHTVIRMYIIARILRIFFALLICYAIRKKNERTLIDQNNQRKQILSIVIRSIFFYMFLMISNISTTIYGIVTSTLGMFPEEGPPSFLAVLWEQLFYGDLFWAILLGCVIVFFPISKKEMQQI